MTGVIKAHVRARGVVMRIAEVSSSEQRSSRRWSFADCVLDEATWSLTVEGVRVPIETKPLELLRELLLARGTVVSKGEILDRVWRGVIVVEGSLPTAVHKLRQALRDEGRSPRIIETVPRIGYRLGVPVELEEALLAAGLLGSSSSEEPTLPLKGHRGLPVARLAAAVAVLLLSLSALLAYNHRAREGGPAPGEQASVAREREALRTMDLKAVERLLQQGWDPNAAMNENGDTALDILLGNCEWDRRHDQHLMLLIARTMVEAGARVDVRNNFGDTPYSIAKAKRYCGPQHPVTRMFGMMCAQGGTPLGDACMASYELKRGAHFRAEQQ